MLVEHRARRQGFATAAGAATYQALRGHLAALRMTAAAEALPGLLDAARAAKQNHTEFLHDLPAIEAAAHAARRHDSLQRFAELPAAWHLDDFDFTAQPTVDRQLMRDLCTCRYLDDATNVLFIGPPGVGKTMLATILGQAAIDAAHLLHHRGRSGRPLPPGRHRRMLVDHHAVLQRTGPPID